MKLTRAQQTLLERIQQAGDRGICVVDGYKPALALEYLGLASRQRNRFSFDRLFLTEAGATQITEAMKP